MIREFDDNGEDEGFEPGAWRSLPQKVAVSKGGMIATAHHRATQAGTDILKAGGNAMDAAIAAAFALGVCEPAASGLGGQTMMLVYDAASGKRIALDGSSRAPNRVAPGILPKPLRLRGHMASTVPSTPAVLAYALERYGSLPLSEVLDPALFLAEDGYRISQLQYALTQSIERVYGSFAAAPDLGFLYNNYMMDFEYDDITHPHYLRPNAVPWATVTPTLVFKGRHPWMAIGSPGSARIASALLQVLIRLKNGESPFDAVDGPRLHCSVQGKVSLENARMRNDIPQRLEKHGFTIDPRGGYSFFLGCVQMVMRGTKGRLMGVADPRRDGSAGGV